MLKCVAVLTTQINNPCECGALPGEKCFIWKGKRRKELPVFHGKRPADVGELVALAMAKVATAASAKPVVPNSPLDPRGAGQMCGREERAR